MTGSRADALARLDIFVGEWVMEARFPGGDGPADMSAAQTVRDAFRVPLSG